MPRTSESDQSPQSIEKIVADLRRIAGVLDAVAQTMRDEKIDRVAVKGAAELARGMNGISKFSHNASQAVRAHMWESGSFGVEKGA